MTDSEFKSLYINEFGPMYIWALLMTLLIMGVIFIGWNGELLPQQSQKIVEKMHWLLAFFDNF